MRIYRNHFVEKAEHIYEKKGWRIRVRSRSCVDFPLVEMKRVGSKGRYKRPCDIFTRENMNLREMSNFDTEKTLEFLSYEEINSVRMFYHRHITPRIETLVPKQ